MIPVIFIVTFFIFSITLLLPGDPAIAMLGEQATQEDLQQLREKMGLNLPIPIQYLRWVGNVATGDLGISLRSSEPVTEMIIGRAPVTLELTLFSILIGIAIGVPTGVFSAVRRNTWVDATSSVTAMGALAIPNFWFGIVLIMFFSVYLRWLPSSGYTPFFANPIGNLTAMILPSVTLGGGLAALVMRQTRSSLLNVLTADYVRTARAKGAREPRVIIRHALRNALLPVVTVIGLQMGTLLGGAVVTETVFSMPGVGRMLIEGIFTRDFPAVQGAILFLILGILIVNLLTDLTYFALDKRISR
jgi:peptide/nickel transport system permease protein